MIIRSIHDAQNRFFLQRRATAQDRRLSSKARGVLAYMLSKPDGWELSIGDLINEFPDLGRDAAYGVVSELIKYGYAKRVQERDPKTGQLGKVRIDVYEMPLTDFQEAATPLPALPDTGLPDAASPDTAKPEHIENRVPIGKQRREETEQQQKTDAAASRFDFATRKDYVVATKPHIKNPGGLATLLASGEEDREIEIWLARDAARRNEDLNRTPFDSWTRQQAEADAQKAEADWLRSLDPSEYASLFADAAQQFQNRYPTHARGNDWQHTHKGAIEKLIITKHYQPEGIAV